MFGYSECKKKNEILRSLDSNYKKFEKGDRSDEEWSVICALVNKIAKDGYLRGNARGYMPIYEVFISDSGMLFRSKGGYVRQFLIKVVVSAVTIAASIATILALFWQIWIN